MAIGNQYGPGSGTIWLDNVRCVGHETSIANCTHNDWGDHNCDHDDDVSVVCGTSPLRYYGNFDSVNQSLSAISLQADIVVSLGDMFGYISSKIERVWAKLSRGMGSD